MHSKPMYMQAGLGKLQHSFLERHSHDRLVTLSANYVKVSTQETNSFSHMPTASAPHMYVYVHVIIIMLSQAKHVQYGT